MPVRKSRGRRRGIQHGVQRHKLRSQPLNSEDSEDTPTMPVSFSFSTAVLHPRNLRALARYWAQISFNTTSSFCCTFCLAPFTRDGTTGRFEVASFWRRVIHFIITVLLYVTCAHKLVMTVLGLTVMPVGTIASAISYAGFQLQVTAMSTGMGFLFLPSLSCELLNCWNPILSEAAARLGQPLRSPWIYLSCSIQILFVFVGVAISTLVFPAFSLVFIDTPIFLFTSLKTTGLISPEGHWFSNVLMQTGCYLFDVAIYAACLSSLGFAVQYIVSEVGFLKVFVNELRYALAKFK